ncbi:MAG: T9SS type A sorting domain-containing protein [Bacteroidota bacterium]
MFKSRALKALIITISIIVILSGETYCQTSGEKSIRVGELWQTDRAIPEGAWQFSYNWPGNHWADKINGPTERETMLANGCARKGGLSAGITDWKDRRGDEFPVVVWATGSSNMCHIDNKAGGSNVWMKVILKRKPPDTYVNGELIPPRQEYDAIDPNLISDAKLSIRWASKIGITFQQDYYGYAVKNADSYLIVDFHALNNGNTDANENDTPELKDQVLHNAYFTYGIQPHIGFEGSMQEAKIWEAQTDDWVEYYGENYLDYIGGGTPTNPSGDPTADSLRVFIVWDGDDPKTEYDEMGDPNNNTAWDLPRPVLGKILSPQYFGMGILHADMSTEDETNDLSQPVTTAWQPATIPEHGWTTAQGYNYFFVGDGSVVGEDWQHHRPSPQEYGYTDPTDPNTVARPNPYITIGPYEMPYNSELHWTMLVAVNGIAQDTCSYYGQKWWEGYKGSSSGITDAEKNALLATGRDSLFKVFSTATRRHFRNQELGRDPFDIPDPPPAPDLWVTAAHRSVLLKWSDVSREPDFDTGVNDFSGYRVYRTQGLNDSTYKMIWECGGNSGNPVSTSFRDTTVQRGFAYYYYVSVYDDGSQNWENPGQSLESGKYWNMTQRNSPVYPYLDPDSVKTEFSMDEITVVPNPYHDLSVKNNWPGEPNKIMFVNLPKECTIKIFTMTGDLVKTLDHTDGTGEEAWNQVSRNNQLVFSGVYLYHVESEKGEKIGKFVIIRSDREDGRVVGF